MLLYVKPKIEAIWLQVPRGKYKYGIVLSRYVVMGTASRAVGLLELVFSDVMLETWTARSGWSFVEKLNVKLLGVNFEAS